MILVVKTNFYLSKSSINVSIKDKNNFILYMTLKKKDTLDISNNSNTTWFIDKFRKI